MANRNKYRYLKTYKPSKEEKRALALTLFSYNEKFIYKRLKSGKYRTYCFTCNTYNTVTPEEFKQIRSAGICPSCFNYVRMGTKQEMENTGYISFPKGKVEDYGFWLIAKWKFGSEPKLTTCEMVLYSDDTKRIKAFRKGVVAGIGYRLYRTKSEKYFKECRYDTYFGRTGYCSFLDLITRSAHIPKKKFYEQVLESLEIEPKDIKSNQRKLIQDGIYTSNQIAFILIFNLKSWEEVNKYKKYISESPRPYFIKERMNRFNIFHLDYLSRNNISLMQYLDYADQCDLLGLKLDKPKDFQSKHRELSELIKIRDNSIYAESIKKNFDNYIQYEYINGKVHILPFETPEEIIKCGSDLHNCIAQYIERYALKQTALFKMLVGDKLEVAIEVRGGVMIQAYRDMNEECNKYQMKHINKWLREVGWVDGR